MSSGFRRIPYWSFRRFNTAIISFEFSTHRVQPLRPPLSAGELLLHAAHFVLHGLLPVHTRSKSQTARDPRNSHFMQGLVTPFDRRKHRVPFTFEVGPVGMKLGLQPSFREDPLAHADLFRNGHPDPNRNYANIRYDFHRSSSFNVPSAAFKVVIASAAGGD